ncbi:MAG: hypothetical protein ACRD2M_03785 [Terriglobales bacterium]
MACLVLLPGQVSSQSAPPDSQSSKTAKREQAFKEFTEHVQKYIELRKKLDASLPALGPKEPQEKIVERTKALAEKIQLARANAKRGDLFAPEIAEEFRHLIRSELQGAKGANARKTIREGDPVKSLRLRVNDAYPEALPVTTVPPALLLKLPELPQEVAYRIVGRDLVLLDVDASLILDFIRKALPEHTL